MLSDMNAEVTKAMDVGMDAMGCLRTRRFSMVIQVIDFSGTACVLKNRPLSVLLTLV
jgi:hypothetical protein